MLSLFSTHLKVLPMPVSKNWVTDPACAYWYNFPRLLSLKLKDLRENEPGLAHWWWINTL